MTCFNNNDIFNMISFMFAERTRPPRQFIAALILQFGGVWKPVNNSVCRKIGIDLFAARITLIIVFAFSINHGFNHLYQVQSAVQTFF